MVVSDRRARTRERVLQVGPHSREQLSRGLGTPTPTPRDAQPSDDTI